MPTRPSPDTAHCSSYPPLLSPLPKRVCLQCLYPDPDHRGGHPAIHLDVLITKVVVFVMATSPDRRNPKKHKQAAAHSILASLRSVLLFHLSLNKLRIAGVIGSHCLFAPGLSLFAPFSTYSTLGIDPMAGSPSPRQICAYRTAAR